METQSMDELGCKGDYRAAPSGEGRAEMRSTIIIGAPCRRGQTGGNWRHAGDPRGAKGRMRESVMSSRTRIGLGSQSIPPIRSLTSSARRPRRAHGVEP